VLLVLPPWDEPMGVGSVGCSFMRAAAVGTDTEGCRRAPPPLLPVLLPLLAACRCCRCGVLLLLLARCCGCCGCCACCGRRGTLLLLLLLPARCGACACCCCGAEGLLPLPRCTEVGRCCPTVGRDLSCPPLARVDARAGAPMLPLLLLSPMLPLLVRSAVPRGAAVVSARSWG
jgi:hypothetical protein